MWGNRAATAGFDLADGHTDGTFYIRARYCAGTCVPVGSEATGLRAGLRGSCAAGRVDSLLSQSRWLRSVREDGLGHWPEAERDTPDLGGRREEKTRRSDGSKRRETGAFRGLFFGGPGSRASAVRARIDLT